MTKAPDSKQKGEQKRRGLPIAAAVLLVVLLGAGSAACMLLGNPSLWMSHKQVEDLKEASSETELGHDQTVLGSYCTISYSKDKNRQENLVQGCKAINGIVVKPGKTFSFNEVVGDTAQNEDYLEAPVFIDGEVAAERGGGVCQVSTTLYLAALRANMQIDERHAHSRAIDYAQLGLDATVSFGQLDFRFTNTTAHDITIFANASESTVTVSIAGVNENGQRVYDVTSAVTDKYTKNGDNGPLDYYVVSSYQTVTEGGVLKTRNLLAIDTYLITDAELVIAPVVDNGDVTWK